MAIEKTFIKEGVKELQIEDFLKEKFDRAGYSHTEIQRTPIGNRIIVYAHKPGLVIGRSGRRINDLTEEIKKKFGFENPLVDVREVDNPFLDANIVANRIAKALERGINYKRACGYYLERVLEEGAVGIQIRVAGKMAGVERSRFQKFRAGFITHSGNYAEKYVDKGFAKAMLRPGMVGVQVRIMVKSPEDFSREKHLGEHAVKAVEPTKEDASPKAVDAVDGTNVETPVQADAVTAAVTDAPAEEDANVDADAVPADQGKKNEDGK
jgi:small subunit ribosomal protein S3